MPSHQDASWHWGKAVFTDEAGLELRTQRITRGRSIHSATQRPGLTTPYKSFLTKYLENTFYYPNFDILQELKEAAPEEVRKEKPQTIAHQQLPQLLVDW